MMTAPRTARIEFLNGPLEGDSVEVPLDDDGLPPELHTVDQMSAYDTAMDPTAGLASSVATQFYERDVAIRGDGIVHVYVWKGEHLNTGLAA